VGFRGEVWETSGKVWVLASKYPHVRATISPVFYRRVGSNYRYLEVQLSVCITNYP